jgi:glycosyltransferase involved in cell wall biosynthesis
MPNGIAQSSKIVLATTTDLAALNASSLHFLGLAKALNAAGQHVTILAPCPSGNLTVELAPGIEQCFSPSVARLGLPGASAIPLMLPALRRLSDRRNLYIRSGIGTLALIRSARLAGFKRTVAEANGWFADDLAALNKATHWQSLAQRLQVAEAKAADAVRVVTAGLGRVFTEHGVRPSKVHHIPNGTDLDVFHPGDRAASRASLGIGLDAEVLVFVGNLWPVIDLRVLFEAAALLAGRRPRLEIIIVGAGVARGQFEEESRHILPRGMLVHWLGSLPQARANNVIAAADVAVAPFAAARNARIGLSPLKLHDYAAAGRVVVATDLPGIAGIAPQPWLHLAKAHDAASYAAAIDQALGGDRTFAERAARAYAEVNFGWGAVAVRIAALF